MKACRGARCEQGQAAVELAAVAALLSVAGLVAFQVLAAGQAAAVADGAAEAAALALANGRDPARAAGAAAHGWPRRAIRVRQQGASVRVTVTPHTPLHILRGRLAISATAWARPPSRGAER